MKKLLNKIIEKLRSMGEENGDDEFMGEIDNAIMYLDSAHDRLIAIEESEDDCPCGEMLITDCAGECGKEMIA